MTVTFTADNTSVEYTIRNLGHAMSNWNHAYRVCKTNENFSGAAFYAQKMADSFAARVN